MAKDKEKKKAAKVKDGNGTGAGASDSVLKPVPKEGSLNWTLRVRNRTQIDRFKRAAALAGKQMGGYVGVNTWAVEVLDRAAQAAGVTR